MKSLHRVLRNFKMPGYTVPEFRRKAVIIAVGGVYDPRIHLDDVVMPVLKKWRIFEREDFTGEAAEMRDDLGKLVEELEDTCEKFEIAKERRLERERKVAEKKADEEPVGDVIGSVLSPTPAARRLRIGPIALRQPGRAGADGRRDERRVPDAVPRTRARPRRHRQRALRLRDGDGPCARRAPPGHHAHDDVRGRTSRRVRCSCTPSTPTTTYAAAKMIVDEDMADHIDMNFGCPVPKVTRRGGGAALPFKRRLFGQIVAAAVRATEGTDIPVTVKFRIGIDDDPPHPSRRGPHRRRGGRRGRRAARPHRGAALLRDRRLGADRRSSSSTSRAFRCSATATSSTPTTRWP